MKKVAIIQSNYIPWKGYFDIIHDADLFIFYDDIQYTKADWRNRNKIKTPKGAVWITIPVGPRDDQLICETSPKDDLWQKKHWSRIEQLYSKAPYFKIYMEFFKDFYLGRMWPNLSKMNQYLIKHIAREFLGIKTEFADSREYVISGKKDVRLLNLLSKAGAELYISGPSARDYINENKYRGAKIELIYKDYAGYPEYAQFYPPFDHNVSIIDLLFHVGQDAPEYIWGWRKTAKRE